MLVLTRYPRQEIVIGDGLVRVRIDQVKGQRVRVAIEADESLRICRSELLDPNHPRHKPEYQTHRIGVGDAESRRIDDSAEQEPGRVIHSAAEVTPDN